MKHFIDDNGVIWAFEADGSQDHLIPENLTAITVQEADAIRNPAPTEEQLFLQAAESVRFALQAAIDAKAKERGFSGGNALMLYAGFTNPYQTIAQQFASWEASVWVEANEYRDEVIAGNEPMLTGEQAVAMMPELVIEESE